mmetsp:Transcript_13035/g.26067  ORF Transcript_13035/g.26067 Transcript_13035/m.26067 type:complete len:141 (-) Transcript_13035:305-727(-)|eukprot:CAMPEP_0181301538 /NCGR_PEP_ID=MMETSP1101-20121128/7477_1 /TAXON_ID=46948 /ORGANISM="Rhodomonas abbreviata, Strain Caron Lab Isolate" /LENGTH=140 /DNA_ID=CAMNT_0023406849 /DNA_START=154 /DNA_END=576 /DNA_ORIENTATION=-
MGCGASSGAASTTAFSGGDGSNPSDAEQPNPANETNTDVSGVQAASSDGNRDDILPKGWARKIDPETGAPYYVNHVDHTTTWKPPTSSDEVDTTNQRLTARQDDPMLLPPGWSSKIDPASGDVYYENHATRQTQWNHPSA